MSAQLLAGGPVADAVLDDVKSRVDKLAAEGKRVGLGTILVGDDEASAGYVRKKHEMCEQLGVASHHVGIDAGDDPSALFDAVDEFNANPEVDAYLIQYPVAEGFDFDGALNRMDPDKDGDGLHPVNLGRLVLGQDGPVPATPAGIRAMFAHYGIDIAGKELVIVGRGPTLGRPLALLLSAKAPGANAAVTVVHSGVADIGAYTCRADIVVAAVGSPSIITPDMVTPGAVVVSGGISWEGRKLLPDVDESVGEVASWITPRLGGVGVTTIAMLMANTLTAAEAAHRRNTDT